MSPNMTLESVSCAQIKIRTHFSCLFPDMTPPSIIDGDSDLWQRLISSKVPLSVLEAPFLPRMVAFHEWLWESIKSCSAVLAPRRRKRFLHLISSAFLLFRSKHPSMHSWAWHLLLASARVVFYICLPSEASLAKGNRGSQPEHWHHWLARKKKSTKTEPRSFSRFRS